MITERNTKYISAARHYLSAVGHATNQDILRHLQLSFPDLSVTTVHRITSRLLERGELRAAPGTRDGSQRFDANLEPHDHFQCARCDNLRDIQLPHEIFETIQDQMGECKLTGRLNVQGACDKCINHTKEEL